MGLLEDIKDAIAIGLMIGTAFIVYKLVTEGPRAVGAIVEQVQKQIGKVVKAVEEVVGGTAKRHLLIKCVSDVHERYALEYWAPLRLISQVNRFCKAAVRVVEAGLYTLEEVLERLDRLYKTYKDMGMEDAKALEHALKELKHQLLRELFWIKKLTPR